MPNTIKINSEPANIVRQLVRAGYEAYVVGGAVRDHLLGCNPKDYDIATSASPEQVRQVFGRRRCQIIGRRFRLALVHGGKNVYEVSTFRREPTEKERKGRLNDDGVMIWNDNAYGTLDDDVKRRDFTVNALYANVLTGEILDKCGGLGDIKTGSVRMIGDPELRFREDPVRMLRALKLVGQHGLKLSRPVLSALRGNACEISKASRSRMFEEIMKILVCGHGVQVLEQCRNHGLLQYFWPALNDIWGSRVWSVMMSMLAVYDEEVRQLHNETPDRFMAAACVCLPHFMECSSRAVPDYEAFPAEKYGKHDGKSLPYAQLRKICLQSVRELFRDYIVSREMQFEMEAVLSRVSMLLNGSMPRTRLTDVVYGRIYELLRIRSLVDGCGADVLVRLPLPLEYSDEMEFHGRILRDNPDESAGDGMALHRTKRRRNRRKKTVAGSEAPEKSDSSAAPKE